jgi:hypothetical protein
MGVSFAGAETHQFLFPFSKSQHVRPLWGNKCHGVNPPLAKCFVASPVRWIHSNDYSTMRDSLIPHLRLIHNALCVPTDKKLRGVKSGDLEGHARGPPPGSRSLCWRNVERLRPAGRSITVASEALRNLSVCPCMLLLLLSLPRRWMVQWRNPKSGHIARLLWDSRVQVE